MAMNSVRNSVSANRLSSRPTCDEKYWKDTDDCFYEPIYRPYGTGVLINRLLVSLKTSQNTGLLTSGHSAIESDGASLLPLDSEDDVSKRVESALDNVQRM